jgi:hypothetical protein
MGSGNKYVHICIFLEQVLKQKNKKQKKQQTLKYNNLCISLISRIDSKPKIFQGLKDLSNFLFSFLNNKILIMFVNKYEFIFIKDKYVCDTEIKFN